jgi:glutamate racemase
MIGLFDSGIGGLTVVRELRRRLPGLDLIYFGDTARTPYGNKSPEVISRYGLEATKFLVDQGCQIVVVACNTVSAVGLDAIKQAYPKLPVFDVITPAVRAVVEHQTNSTKPAAKNKSRIGIMGTRALVKSGLYQKLLAQAGSYQVIASAAPLLVPLVEEGWLNSPETKRVIKRYLTPFKQAQVQALVLACTHYPLLKNIITPRLGKRVWVVDPAVETVKAVAGWLSEHPEVGDKLAKGPGNFYVSDWTEHTQAIAQKWLGQKIKLAQVKLDF